MIKQYRKIVLFGDSQIEYGDWNALFERNDILNYGVAGDTVAGLIRRLDIVCNHNPSKVFIQIGTNDLSMGLSRQQILESYEQLVDNLTNQSSAIIYVNSILPVQDLPGEFYQNSEILALNRSLKQLCQSKGAIYIDFGDTFTDDLGNLDTTLTYDGLHLNDNGYFAWAQILQSLL